MTAAPKSAVSEAEAEVEHARAGLGTTLQQLRENLKPANVADEMLVHARSTTNVVTEHAWELARRNPLSAILIGAGAAFALGVGGKAVMQGGEPPAGSDTGPVRAASISGESRVPFQGSDLLDIANGGLRLLAHRTRTAFSQARPGSASSQEAMMTGSTHPRDRIKHSVSRAVDEQPLMLAVLGLAAGAALGALMPKTDAENELMGDRAQALRDQARSTAQDKVETLKTAAAHAVEGIKQTAAEHGVSSENLSGLVHDVGEHTKRAAYEAGTGLDPTT